MCVAVHNCNPCKYCGRTYESTFQLATRVGLSTCTYDRPPFDAVQQWRTDKREGRPVGICPAYEDAYPAEKQFLKELLRLEAALARLPDTSSETSG